jgi:hypothetical protein
MGGAGTRTFFFNTASRRASRATPCSRSRRGIRRGSRGTLRLFRNRLVDRIRNWTARDWRPNLRTRARGGTGSNWKLWRMPGCPSNKQGVNYSSNLTHPISADTQTVPEIDHLAR